MKKKLLSFIALSLVALFVLPVLCSCTDDEEQDDGKIKFYLWNADGLMPSGFQEVLDKYNSEYAPQNGGLQLEFKFEATQDTYKQNLNLYFSAQRNTYDVVFDAQWILLERFASTGYYYDLTSYFNNDAYPGLKKAFASDYVENNKYSNGVYGIPITESFGDIGVCFIRKDWRELCAQDKDWEKPSELVNNTKTAADLADGIDNCDEFEYYIYWVNAHKGQGTIPANVIPIACNQDGAYSAYEIIAARNADAKTPGDYYNAGVMTDIRITADLYASAYIDEHTGEVEAVTLDNLNPSATGGLSSFPDGFNSQDNTWQDNYATIRRWQVDGMLGDVANETESVAKFKNGIAGAVLQSISNFNELENAIKAKDSSAELEIFIHDEKIRSKEAGVQSTDYRAWNYLAIPKSVSANKVPKIMKFFDWLFESRENHDLFQYGIKGVHWDEAKDAGGNYIENTVTTTGMQPYTFTAYLLTWNPTYIRVTYASDPKVMEYSQYMYDINRYTPKLYAGFVFATVGRSQEVATALNNPDISTARSNITAYQLGLVNDPVSKWQGNLTALQNNTSLQNALVVLQQDLKQQLQQYIDSLN